MGPYNKARRKGSDIAGDHGDDDHDEDLEEGNDGVNLNDGNTSSDTEQA